MILVVTIPIRTKNTTNGATGNSRKAAIIKSRKRAVERGSVCMIVRSEAVRMQGSPPFPLVVWLTRLSPGTLDDDGLRAALKSVRDGVADALGIKDNDPRVRWEYAQEKTKRFTAGRLPANKYAVRISIEPREPFT